MIHRNLIRSLFVAAAASWAIVASPLAATPDVPIEPGTLTRYYKLNVSVRPFLLWMTRQDVGGARVSWNAPGSDERLELLIGSDPERAPMSINRWGFITEHSSGGTTEITGLMTETDDRAIDAARTNAAAMRATQVFRSIRSTVSNGEATSSVARIVLPDNVSYRDYATLLEQIAVPVGTAAQRLRLPAGAEPGFLMATRHILETSAADWQRTRRGIIPVRRAYVYSGKTYELSLKSGTFVEGAIMSGRNCGPAIEGQFEIRQPASGFTTTFTMLYGLTGDHAATPLRVVYRPRWWVELELLLVDPRASKNAFALRQVPTP